MRAQLAQLTHVQDQDVVSVLDRGEPVRDDDARAASPPGSPGIYFLTLSAGARSITRQVVRVPR